MTNFAAQKQITYEETSIFMPVCDIADDTGMCATTDAASLAGEACGLFW